MTWKRRRLGLALGGGGARGMAHIGVFRVFERESIPIDLIVGSSIGALVGGAFASGMGAAEMQQRTEEFLNSAVFQNSALKSIKEMQASKKLSLTQKIQAFLKNRITLAQAMFRPGILEKEDFQGMIDFFLPDMQIQDLRICFRAMATDLITGEPVVISEGPLRKAVLASCAVPGAVPPIQINDAQLSDGGIINMVPAGVARDEGAGFVVAVSVNTEIFSEEKLSSAWDIYARSSNITGFHLEKCLLQDADVVIRPNVGKLHWTDFTLAADLILEGERATINKLPDLINVLPGWRRIMKKRKGL